LKLTIALVLIVAVLMVRPSGIFGRSGRDPGMTVPTDQVCRQRQHRRRAGRRQAWGSAPQSAGIAVAASRSRRR